MMAQIIGIFSKSTADYSVLLSGLVKSKKLASLGFINRKRVVASTLLAIALFFYKNMDFF